MSNVALNRQFDVVVLGGGAAGSVASATVASHGRTVLLVSQFAGATAQSSGAVDGGEARSLEMFQKVAGGLLAGATNSEGLLVASEAGTLKAASLVQQTQCFDWRTMSQAAKIGVVGFSGLSSFDAEAVAKMLAWSAKQILGYDLHVVPFHVAMKGPWRSSLEMAKWLDSESESQELQSVLKKTLQGCAAYVLPAVLGVERYRDNWERLQAIAPVYELLAMPTSVPGLRLQSALMKGVSSHGVQTANAQAKSTQIENDRIVYVDIDGPAGFERIACKAVILATGRYFSGGFERSGIRRERLFRIPLWWRDRLIEDLPSRGLTSSNMSDEHALLEASIRTDESLRPYTQTMDLCARNLFVAGSGLTRLRSLGSCVQSGFESAFHTLKEFQGQ